jgi:hypothetical protein
MPVCSARPPHTPAIRESVRLRVSRGRAEAPEGREKVVAVMYLNLLGRVDRRYRGGTGTDPDPAAPTDSG